jgi:toxin YoeB
MEIVLSKQAQKDIEFWKKTKNTKIQARIIELKDAIILDPYQGIGNPEQLKHQLTGKWSRRIDKVNRFVYHIEQDQLHIFSLKGHY